MSGGWQGGDGPWGKPRGTGGLGGNNGGEPPRRAPGGKKPAGWDDAFKNGSEKFNEFFNGSDAQRNVVLAVLAVTVLWLASGLYIVQPDEQGVVLRFGKYHRTATPGPNYHLPWPVESVQTPTVTAINRIVIGGSERTGTNDEPLMLTGDENIVDLNYEVQWKIKEAEQYLFNVRNPSHTVEAVAESAMREVVGQMPVANELSQLRVELEQRTKGLMQGILDSYKSGIEIVSVNIKELNPPSEVIEAFYDVQRAKADQERLRNEAEAYRNDILPKARGQAEQMIQNAQAYREQVIAQAKGDAARFSSVYKEYLNAKEVTKKRMYLETMEQIYRGMNKVIVDPKTSGTGVVPYLPLPSMPMPAKEEKTGAANAN